MLDPITKHNKPFSRDYQSPRCGLHCFILLSFDEGLPEANYRSITENKLRAYVAISICLVLRTLGPNQLVLTNQG